MITSNVGNALLFRGGATQKTTRRIQIAGSEQPRAGDVCASRSRRAALDDVFYTRNEPARAGSNTVGCRRGLAFGWGLAAGIGAAMGVLVGRKALVQAKVGRRIRLRPVAWRPARPVLSEPESGRCLPLGAGAVLLAGVATGWLG
jgi:hypothetical protein